jgi:uncharacterized protein
MARRKRAQDVAEGAALSLLIGGVAVAAAEIGRRLYRHTQVFCPTREPVKSWDWTDYGIPKDAVEEVFFETPDGEELHGWYCRAGKPVASGVFCHGNTANLTLSADVIPHLLAAGFNVLFFDYRGFGKSTGVPTIPGVISDGITAARFHDRIRPKHLPSVLYGFSLGGAIAAQVIRRHPFDALILQSTFTSLTDMARVLYRRLPMHLLAGSEFDTIAVIRKLQVPLLVLHGTADEAIPCDMAHALFNACAHPVRRIHCINGGLHKDLYLRDPDSLIWQISQFIASLPAPGRTSSVEQPPPVEEWTDAVLRMVRRMLRRRAPQHA